MNHTTNRMRSEPTDRTKKKAHKKQTTREKNDTSNQSFQHPISLQLRFHCEKIKTIYSCWKSFWWKLRSISCIHVRYALLLLLCHRLYRFSFWKWLFMSWDLSSVLTFSLDLLPLLLLLLLFSLIRSVCLSSFVHYFYLLSVLFTLWVRIVFCRTISMRSLFLLPLISSHFIFVFLNKHLYTIRLTYVFRFPFSFMVNYNTRKNI